MFYFEHSKLCLKESSKIKKQEYSWNNRKKSLQQIYGIIRHKFEFVLVKKSLLEHLPRIKWLVVNGFYKASLISSTTKLCKTRIYELYIIHYNFE